MTGMLLDQRDGKIDSWAVRFGFTHFKEHCVAILPCIPYVDNIGFDGTGRHSGVNLSGEYRNDLSLSVKDPKFVDMDRIMEIADRHGLFVVEDAAQAIDSYYKGRPLGSIGHLAAFSFHETKNIIAGEGGMLVINDERFIRRAEIIWEKGTNRAEFFRGEVNKYGWCDTGSSFLPSEIVAAFLWAQLEQLDEIQEKRKALWDHYYKLLKPLSDAGLF